MSNPEGLLSSVALNGAVGGSSPVDVLPRFCHELNSTHLIEEHVRDVRTRGIMLFRSARLTCARFQIPPSPL